MSILTAVNRRITSLTADVADVATAVDTAQDVLDVLGWKCLEKSDGAVLNGADNLFTVSGGPVLATVVGIVTTVIGGAANATLGEVVTTPSGTVSLSTTVAIDNDAAGTSYRFVGATGVLTPVTAGAVIVDPVTVADCYFLLPIGTLVCTCSAARTGNIKWYLSYRPLSPNSVVAVAA